MRHLSGPGDKPDFPAIVEYVVTFEPSVSFGTGSGRSRTVFDSSDTDLMYNEFTGKAWAETVGPGPLATTAMWDGVPLVFSGPEVRARMMIPDEATFVSVLIAMHSYLPLVLGVRLRETISAAATVCLVGDVEYKYLAVESPGIPVNETSLGLQATRVREAVADLAALYELDAPGAIRPVVASIKYFLTAQRLLDIGLTPREFFGEVVLNYAKALEALWGGNRDQIRTGLKTLGVPQSQVESVFVPVCLLRNELDVGHASVVLPSQTMLNSLYGHIESLGMYYVALYERLLAAIRDGKTPYRRVDETHAGTQELEAILASFERMPSLKNKGTPHVRYRFRSGSNSAGSANTNGAPSA